MARQQRGGGGDVKNKNDFLLDQMNSPRGRDVGCVRNATKVEVNTDTA